MIVDAHVHFWDPAELDYPWIEAVPTLRRAFLPGDYTSATADADASVARLVAVEANAAPSQATREVGFFDRLAAVDSRISAIVAFVPLSNAAARDRVLDSLREHPRVKGVRQNIQSEPRGFCLHDAFVDGVREVGRRGYTFDLCVTSDQLAEAITLVERCPDTRFVLDHAGKPRIRDGADPWWHEAIERLASYERVWCKISGLLTEASAAQGEAAVLPYACHAVDCFGDERVMYGSDWPVLTLAGSYADWMGVARSLTMGWTAEAMHRFYCDNATRFYGL